VASYEAHRPIGSVPERRAAFRGWIQAPIVADRFFSAAFKRFGDAIRIEVSDGVSVGLEVLGKLYDEPTVIRLAYALEQALLPETTTPERRTYLLAWYGLILDVGLAIGSLLAGVPALLRGHWGWPQQSAYSVAWFISAALALGAAALSATLSSRVEIAAPRLDGPRRLAPNITAESKRRRSETVPSASPDVPANFKQFGVSARISSAASGI